MSHHSLKSLGHGFCDAIFSSSPINFDKENTDFTKKKGKTCSAVLEKQQQAVHSPDRDKCSKNEKRKILCDNDITENSRPPSKLVTKCLTRSKSASTLHKQQTVIPGILKTDERHKTPIKLGSPSASSASNDKTPVAHFCTPKHVKIRTGINKINILPPNRTPIKRYFSDNVLSQATPDCFSAVHVETPCGKSTEIAIEDQTVCEGESSNLTVGIRVRPLNTKELNDPKVTSIVEVNGQNISVDCESTRHTFMYDHCFISHSDSVTAGHASQETIFKSMVLPLVQSAFEGYNVCLLAYGQTGSGKSYSMMGQESLQTTSIQFDESVGIIPRFCQEIFTRMHQNAQTKTTVEISYFEIYNEKIHDLLTNVNSGTKRAPLKVRQHPVFGPYIVDLSQHSVQSFKDLQTWLKVGNSQRAVTATGMNEKSSRSHSIFSIILTQTDIEGQLANKSGNASRRSKINLVDLAGSERLSQTCASGDRLKEGVSINKSLLTLGKVIASLAENTNNRKKGFVPYRESVLTWLLKESLGGNSRTAMLGTVSPASIHMEETLATLRYACQARAIVNRIRINEDPHERLIRELKAEVLRLRGVREGYEKQLGIFPRRLLDCIEPVSETNEEIKQKQREIDKLKDQLRKTEEQLATTQTTWLERLQRTEEEKNSELKYSLRRGIEIDFQEKDKHPYLVNLADDPMSSRRYFIPHGKMRIGRNCGPSQNRNHSKPCYDAKLDGPLIKPLHCIIERDHGKLTLTPKMGGDTYVNGKIVTGKIVLRHGDRLVLGGHHYFRITNPFDKQNVNVEAIDSEFVHQEILRVQEQELRAELENRKQEAIKELENAKREVEIQLSSQKSSYEHKIETLGSTLEEQKLALEQINQRKKELELEKELLASEVEINNRIKQIQLKEPEVDVSPYQSNFLQELESVLNEITADAEHALRMETNADAFTVSGITLHEIRMLVKEATERCREAGFNYKFDLQHVIINKSLRLVIRIRNTALMKGTMWQPTQFVNWFSHFPENSIEESIKELRASEDSWDPYEDSEALGKSLNSSRMSINMTPVMKRLNESLHQLSMDASMLGNTMIDQTLGSPKLQENINACLLQMELAAESVQRLCHDNKDIRTVKESLDKIQNIIDSLRNTIEHKDMIS